MKFFVDTADTAEIKSLAASGLLDGVTTNPSLVAKSGRRILDVIAEICATVPGPVSAEVAATEYDGMLAEARVLRRIAKNVAVKVPLTPDGLRACRHLSDDGAMVNVTLCFSAAQALLAAKAGASFISPFVGRLDDIGQDGMALIADIVQIYRNYALQDRGAGGLRAPPDPRDHRGQARRPRRHAAARGAAPALQPSADRQGSCRLPCRLGEDRPADRMTAARPLPDAAESDLVAAFLRAHPAWLAEHPELYRLLAPPRRVHGEALADHMAAMLRAERAHATRD